MKAEITEVKNLIMQSNSSRDPAEIIVPSQKDLKDYSSKLQQEYLKSDQTVKVKKLMNKAPPEGIKLFQSSSTMSKPLKLTKKGPIKVLKQESVDMSPLKVEDQIKEAKIVKISMKRQSSQTKIVKIRQSS